jgi:hypothetical protein
MSNTKERRAARREGHAMSKDPKNPVSITPAMKELGIVSEIQGILGNATIKVHECVKAKELMDWLEAHIVRAQSVVDAEANEAEAKLAPVVAIVPEAPAEAPASA